MADQITVEELKKTHKDYDYWLPEWKFFKNSYKGGKAYREGNYLLQHPFESTANYERRKSTAYFYNYCAPIIDIYNAFLFKTAPTREYGVLAKDPLFKNFLLDADLEGTTFPQFMRKSERLASMYGRISIIVDKPSSTIITKGQAIEQDIRPYCTIITPENLLDWVFEQNESGRWVLNKAKVYEGIDNEGRQLYRIWGIDGWVLWGISTGGGDNPDDEDEQVVLLGSGNYDLDRVPIVTLFNKRTEDRMIGISDINDLADINKNIYYLCSDAKEIIENTAFPMLTVPFSKTSSEEKTVGPKNVWEYDPEFPSAKPAWLEPPHSSLSEIREWIKQDIEEMHRIAKMGGLTTTDGSVQPWSGVALETERDPLYAALSEKGDNLEEAEEQILALWALWEGKKFDGKIDYPDNFSIRELNVELQNAITLLEGKVKSKTFNNELQSKIAGSVLPKLSNEIKEQIKKEIADAETNVDTDTDTQTD